MKSYKIFLVIGGRGTIVQGKSEIWVRNLYDPLVALGHQVTLLDIDAYAEKHGVGYMSAEAKELLSNELSVIFAKEHAATKFDIFFSYLHAGQIDPDALRQIKRDVFTINYSTNYHQFEIYQEIAQIVDLNIAIYRRAREGFDRIGAKVYWMPFAGNPDFYKAGPRDPANVAVFVGSNYGHRPYYLWRALQRGVDLHIYGPGWQQPAVSRTIAPITTHVKGSRWKYWIKATLGAAGLEVSRVQRPGKRDHGDLLPNLDDSIRGLDAALMHAIVEEMNRTYPCQLHEPLSDMDFADRLSSAAICVNISEAHPNHDFLDPNVLFGYGLRDFEATLSGACVCTQYYEDLQDFFEIGREIEVFHTPYDLADKLEYYLRYDSKREAIARAGYERAIKDHTWQKRFQDFFNTLRL